MPLLLLLLLVPHAPALVPPSNPGLEQLAAAAESPGEGFVALRAHMQCSPAPRAKLFIRRHLTLAGACDGLCVVDLACLSHLIVEEGALLTLKGVAVSLAINDTFPQGVALGPR